MSKLNKSIYGLHPLVLMRNTILDKLEVLRGRLLYDPCAYHKTEEGLIINIYVDDIFLSGRKNGMGRKHILQYLYGTREYALEYRKTGKIAEAYSYADWRSNEIDKISYNGYVINIEVGVVSWCSCKQHCVALSTIK